MAKNEQADEVKAAAKDATAPVDRVLAVSRHADGSPAQSDNFQSMNSELTAEISKNQLRELHVSNVDHAIRSAEADAGEPYEDAVNKALREAHEAAAAEGEKKAAAEKV